MKAGPVTPVTPGGKPKKATTFQEFESITSDAWEVGDDDDELLAMAARNLNIEVVMETANKVIANHTKQRESPGRLVKSHSDAPLGSPRDEAGERAALHRQRSLPPRPPIIPMVARITDQNTSETPVMTEREASRLDKFRQLLAGPHTDLEELRKLSWSGIPRQVRPITWKLLSIFERILFIWAIRHPASGYVQGINDLVTPFFVVYVFEYIGESPPPSSLTEVRPGVAPEQSGPD
ncbi:hypothetical protein NHX12_020413 [Muraenolepis orangiensis]|uniref:Rab-GAP TBC domain-containing protein n=1 Tax=Muraenolepis orangiensis TaxID=630683 RepID=A0A9Q0EUT7_9TELE|nr:hypothetical protein NHX12_020413 [Muraenolepis orangiensis]